MRSPKNAERFAPLASPAREFGLSYAVDVSANVYGALTTDMSSAEKISRQTGSNRRAQKSKDASATLFQNLEFEDWVSAQRRLKIICCICMFSLLSFHI